MSTKKLEKIILDIYRDLYANAEPKADFDELMRTAEVMEDGRKKIDYDSYEIDGKLMEKIIIRHSQKNNLDKSELSCVKFNIYLGASPRQKKVKLHE